MGAEEYLAKFPFQAYSKGFGAIAPNPLFFRPQQMEIGAVLDSGFGIVIDVGFAIVLSGGFYFSK